VFADGVERLGIEVSRFCKFYGIWIGVEGVDDWNIGKASEWVKGENGKYGKWKECHFW
jgi:hypothetical protein